MNIFFFSWLTVSLLFLMLEIGHPGLFYFISFAGGATVAAIVSVLFPQALFAQGLLFLIASVVTLLMLRYWVSVTSNQYHEQTHTNVYALEGQRAQVIKRITRDAVGEVKIKGELWMARTEETQPLEVGEWVTVVKVSGASVLVIRER